VISNCYEYQLLRLDRGLHLALVQSRTTIESNDDRSATSFSSFFESQG
jgi:hypothetical protein